MPTLQIKDRITKAIEHLEKSLANKISSLEFENSKLREEIVKLKNVQKKSNESSLHDHPPTIKLSSSGGSIGTYPKVDEVNNPDKGLTRSNVELSLSKLKKLVS